MTTHIQTHTVQYKAFAAIDVSERAYIGYCPDTAGFPVAGSRLPEWTTLAKAEEIAASINARGLIELHSVKLVPQDELPTLFVARR